MHKTLVGRTARIVTTAMLALGAAVLTPSSGEASGEGRSVPNSRASDRSDGPRGNDSAAGDDARRGKPVTVPERVVVDHGDDATPTPTTSTSTTSTSTTTTTTVPHEDEAPSTGEVWYVAAGAPSRGDGSVDRPFASIQQGLDRAQPGDAVEVADGLYHETLDFPRSGTADAEITVYAANPLGAHVRGEGDTGNSTRLIEMHQSHIVFRGFEVSHSNILLYSIGGTSNEIAGNWFHHSGGEAVRLKYHADDNEFHHNTVEDSGRKNFDRDGIIDPDGSKNGEGLYLGTSPSQLDRNPTGEVDTSRGNWIHHNTFRHGSEGINLKEGTTANLIEDNEILQAGDPDAAGINVQGEGNTVRSNSVRYGHGAGVRLGVSTPTGDGIDRGVANTVTGNVITGHAGYGVKIISTPQQSICENTLVDNAAGATNDSAYDPAASCG